MASKIEKLLQQRELLDKRIKEIAAKENAAKRKEDTRRKVIIGAWVIEHRPNLVKEIIENFTRDQDKAAFADFNYAEYLKTVKNNGAKLD